MTRIVTWSLKIGSADGQETAEQKRQEGLNYIEKLKESEVVEEWKEENNKFIIYLQD